MRIQPISSDAIQTPNLLAAKLPPQILERAADGVCWMSLIGAVSSVALTMINHILQPEVAVDALLQRLAQRHRDLAAL